MRADLTLHVERGVLRAQAARLGWSAETTWQTAEDLAGAVTSLMGELRARKQPAPRSVCVSFHPPVAQRRTLAGLPPVGTSDLKKLVAVQAARFFRGGRSPMVTDAVWIRRSGAGPIALAAAAERRVVEGILAAAAEAGLSVRAAGIEAEPGRWLSLFPAKVGRSKGRARALVLSVVAVAGVLVVAGTVFTGRAILEQRRLDREIASLGPAAAALDSLARRAAEVRDAFRMLEAARQSRRRTLELFSAVVLALPDSAYLTALSLSADGHGTATGMAQRPSEVVAGLERHGGVQAPRLDRATAQLPTPSAPWVGFNVQFGQAPE
ncbi:MAG TPA: hypothetical protein VGQ17_09080 [Gemmatimonadales bacterium]|jgi:hypothetical protein|nr:hypothetical protein [Gemmatimonadales bacterium]